jgi:hypothetical protein
MPVQYNPTDSRFLTVAQSRTNNGQKDIRIILDIPTNDFYSLDDDGNFNIIGGAGTITLEQVLTQGNSTGGNTIFSPDLLTELNIIDGSGSITCGDGGNRNNYIQVVPGKNDYLSIDLGNNDNTYIEQESTNISLRNTSSNGDKVNQVSISQTSISGSFQTTGVTNTISVDENAVNVLYNDVVNQIFSGMYGDNTKAELYYVDNVLAYNNKVQITKDDIKLIYDNIGGALNYEFLLADNGFYLKNLPAYADDAAATGLPRGYLYQTDGTGASPLDVAGILMIKQ